MTSVRQISSSRAPDSLADVLERVLDKGVVIAGDIVVNVLDIELLSLKLRLFIASAQTAREMGMDWWTRDPFYGSVGAAEQEQEQLAEAEDEVAELRERVRVLEELLAENGLAGAIEDGHDRR
jgi:Gas vesicle protein